MKALLHVAQTAEHFNDPNYCLIFFLFLCEIQQKLLVSKVIEIIVLIICKECHGTLDIGK